MKVRDLKSATDSAHIASLLVQCRPEKLHDTAAAVEALPGLEVPERDERGKLVALIEAPDEANLLGSIRQIEQIPGVISATLVYHQVVS